MDEVVDGSILVEAMEVSAVRGPEELKEVVEEVVDLDDSLIGDWRQADLDRIRNQVDGKFVSQERPDATRRGVGISG